MNQLTLGRDHLNGLHKDISKDADADEEPEEEEEVADTEGGVTQERETGVEQPRHAEGLSCCVLVNVTARVLHAVVHREVLAVPPVRTVVLVILDFGIDNVLSEELSEEATESENAHVLDPPDLGGSNLLH